MKNFDAQGRPRGVYPLGREAHHTLDRLDIEHFALSQSRGAPEEFIAGEDRSRFSRFQRPAVVTTLEVDDFRLADDEALVSAAIILSNPRYWDES